MRKIYFLGIALFGLVLHAQLTDDFESYPEGSYFGGHWSTWSGTNNSGETIQVSTAQASSGTKSGFIGSGGTQDAILKLGNKFTGIWTFQQKLYVPTGNTGYFNFQEDEDTGASGGIWGLQIYFNAGGAGEIQDDTGVAITPFSFPHDTWFTVTSLYDLDEGSVVIDIDGTEIYNGNPYLDSFQLGGVDYYSASATNQLYIDDIIFVEGPIMGVGDINTASVSVYPTVVNDSFNVSAKSNISEIAVFNTLGQQVMRVVPQSNSAQVNVNSLLSGVYVVKVMAGKEVKTSKIVVK